MKIVKRIIPSLRVAPTAVLLLLSAGPWAWTQEIANPGFEQELSDWTAKADYDMSRTATEAARTGNFGLRVVDEDPSKGSGLQSLPIAASVGKKTQITFWARTISGEGGVRVSLCFLDENFVRIGKNAPSVLVKNSPEWQEFKISGVAPESAAAFYVQISSMPLEMVTADFDDFSSTVLD